jgi:hypothetical protein
MADYFGIGKTTFYELMKQQPGVSERYKKGKAKAISEEQKAFRHSLKLPVS